MAVIIDMEMPENCYQCDLHNYHFCDLTGNLVEENWNNGTLADDCPLKPMPKIIITKQLEEMYEKFRSKLWREREDVRGDDMIEIGYAEQFLEELLYEFGCWCEEDEC